MKYAALLAASALMAGAEAKVHKMKMKKIPLDEQLKSYTMHDMSRVLSQKYSKYTRGNQYMETMFSSQGGHKVPVTNYMNAQCMLLIPT
jgi:saccharopepsin